MCKKIKLLGVGLVCLFSLCAWADFYVAADGKLWFFKWTGSGYTVSGPINPTTEDINQVAVVPITLDVAFSTRQGHLFKYNKTFTTKIGQYINADLKINDIAVDKYGKIALASDYGQYMFNSTITWSNGPIYGSSAPLTKILNEGGANQNWIVMIGSNGYWIATDNANTSWLGTSSFGPGKLTAVDSDGDIITMATWGQGYRFVDYRDNPFGTAYGPYGAGWTDVKALAIDPATDNIYLAAWDKFYMWYADFSAYNYSGPWGAGWSVKDMIFDPANGKLIVLTTSGMIGVWSVGPSGFTAFDGYLQDVLLSNTTDLVAVPYLSPADISGQNGQPDGVVNEYDLDVVAGQWLGCTDPYGVGCVQLKTRTVHQGTATVDGDLSDWAGAQWYPFIKTAGQPNDVIDAKWALRWDNTTNLLYLAVQITDTYELFTNSFVNWYGADHIEVFVDASNSDDFGFYTAADWSLVQQYMIGRKADGSGTWRVLADDQVPLHPSVPAAWASSKTGNTTVYEAALHPFSYFAQTLPASDPSQEFVDLEAGITIGFDVVVHSVSQENPTANTGYVLYAASGATGQYNDAKNYLNMKLEPIGSVCGDWGYFKADLNADCKVNLLDFAILAYEWLKGD